jgi:hypothetical protein
VSFNILYLKAQRKSFYSFYLNHMFLHDDKKVKEKSLTLFHFND